MASFDRGKYVCKITSQGFSESKENKTPFFFLAFAPQGRINPDDPDGSLHPCDDYERDVKFWLTEKAIETTIRRLQSLGWEGQSFQELEPNGKTSFVGRHITLQCEHEDYNDKIYDKWEWPYEGGNSIESIEGMGRKFDALFGRQLKKSPKKQAPVEKVADAVASEVPQTVPSDSSETGDDIPF